MPVACERKSGDCIPPFHGSGIVVDNILERHIEQGKKFLIKLL